MPRIVSRSYRHQATIRKLGENYGSLCGRLQMLGRIANRLSEMAIHGFILTLSGSTVDGQGPGRELTSGDAS